MRLRKKVYGVGVNDATYKTSPRVNGQQILCPYFTRWKSMLRRCYSEHTHKRRPNYVGCTVCEEWLTFSVFRAWMITQDWKDKDLDKDLLFPGNTVYSPSTCLFVSGQVNKFLNEREAQRGEWPLGVSYNKVKEKFVAACSPLGDASAHIGYFDTPDRAQEAYKNRKKQLAIVLASMQTDARISQAILKRYI